MIIAKNRKQVIANIRENLARHAYNQAAEINDPELSQPQTSRLVHSFWRSHQKASIKIADLLLRGLFCLITPLLTSRDQIDNSQDLNKIDSAYITCNHYNQLDVLPIKKLAMHYHRRLYFFLKASNLAMKFPIAQILKLADSIPILMSAHYLGKVLPAHLQQILRGKNWVLVFPEQELWFNYRKPRPLQKGVYYYAAKFNRPIISCFAEIQNCPQSELFHRDFCKTKVILHVLPTIWPEQGLNVRQKANQMKAADYRQKKQAYEKAYGHELTYAFSWQDIAGLKKGKIKEYK